MEKSCGQALALFASVGSFFLASWRLEAFCVWEVLVSTLLASLLNLRADPQTAAPAQEIGPFLLSHVTSQRVGSLWVRGNCCLPWILLPAIEIPRDSCRQIIKNDGKITGPTGGH